MEAPVVWTLKMHALGAAVIMVLQPVGMPQQPAAGWMDAMHAAFTPWSWFCSHLYMHVQ